jgi:hypothetical protein
VIKRLKSADDGRHHEEQWPEVSEHRRERYLYAGRRPFRKMRVMVDFELLEAAPPQEAPTARQLLTELLEHELVSTFRYADGGPPPGIVPDPDGTFKGWVVIDGHRQERGWTVVFSSAPDSFTRAGTMGNAPEVAEADVLAPAYADLAAHDAARRRRLDALAAQVASQALGADVYVTERPYLHAATWDVARGVTVCRPEQALAVLGLYFRAQGVFPVGRNYHFNRGLFYWVGMRELLPEAWRWFNACVKHSSNMHDDGLMVLGGSLLQRVDRALETRDQIHLALNQPQNNDTQDAALSNLDLVLVLLMAALDVAARVAHRVLQLPPSDEYRAGWQNQRKGGWLDQVRQGAAALAALVDPSGRGEAVLTIVRLLRNSVHGAGLQGVAYLSAPRRLESLVALPGGDRDEVRSSMLALGGLEGWGVRLLESDRLHLDPGVFADRLIHEVGWLLNELMKQTPVERLPEVALSDADCQPPTGPPGRALRDEFVGSQGH